MTKEIIPDVPAVVEIDLKSGKKSYEFMYPNNDLSYELPWPVLKESASIVQQSRTGGTRTKPVDSWDFIQSIEKMLHEGEILYEKSPIIINKNSCFKVLNSEQKVFYQDKHVPVDKWIFEKMIMRFSFVNEGSVLVPGIALSLGKRGYELRYGYDVQICKNMCIFGTNKIMSTFTGGNNHEQATMKEMLYELSEWIKNYEQNLSTDRKIIRSMIETPFDMEANWKNLLGGLYLDARKGMKTSIFTPPIQYNNLGEISDRIDGNRNNWSNISTVWGVYNLITSILKPEVLNLDIGNVMGYHAEWSNYLMDNFVNPFTTYEDLSDDLSDITTDQINGEIITGIEITKN